MTLPLFTTTEDPGPDFAGLIRRLRVPAHPLIPGDAAAPPGGFRHGTTVVALRFADGVVMAGDRRATEGHAIAHRAMEKVFPADRYSAVAIAGAAGPAVEMVRLFQTQLEHYEKVEGVVLSLEGKANQLGQMVREHLPMAMQGLAVVPLFAGYDLARGPAGSSPTTSPVATTRRPSTTPPARVAATPARPSSSATGSGMARDDAVELAIQSLYEAADEDSATGGPDLIRGIYPLVATVTAEGFAAVPEEEVAERFAALIERRRTEGRQP